MSRKKKQEPINNLIVIADLHCGCQYGLCPASGCRLDEGGWYYPNKEQKRVWRFWQNDFWDKWVPMVCRGEPFAVVCNGDATDGVHHGAETQISQNLSDQGNLAYEILAPVVEKCKGNYYHIRGTEAHSGPSGQEEERLAQRLGAIPNDKGQYARWEMWLRLNWALVHITHHIGTSGSMAYETSAVQKELEQYFVEAGRWNDKIPDVIIRSHRHRNIETRIQTHKGFATACVTAGWQLKTPFLYRVAGARRTSPQIGGTLVRCGDEDVYTRHKLRRAGRSKEVLI